MVEQTNERLAKLQREHPRLYAVRHLAKPIGSLLVAVAGVGIFFLLPLPSIDLPSIPSPDLPDLPDWLASLLHWGKFAVLIVIGVLVATAEVGKHRAPDDTGEGGE